MKVHSTNEKHVKPLLSGAKCFLQEHRGHPRSPVRCSGIFNQFLTATDFVINTTVVHMLFTNVHSRSQYTAFCCRTFFPFFLKCQQRLCMYLCRLQMSPCHLIGTLLFFFFEQAGRNEGNSYQRTKKKKLVLSQNRRV